MRFTQHVPPHALPMNLPFLILILLVILIGSWSQARVNRKS